MRVVNRRLLPRKRILIPLGGGLTLLLLGWFVLLPWVVRWRVGAVLRQLNLGDVTFRVTRATPWTSTVRDVDAGGGNRIDELRVTYSVEGLWNRSVDNIRIRGLQLTADVVEGGVRIRPLDAILRDAPHAASQPAAGAAEQMRATAGDWPFRSVRVEDSHVVVRTSDRAIALPFTATLQWPDLRAELGGLTVEGAIGDPRATHVRFGGNGIDGDDLTAVLQALAPEAPVRIAGDVRVAGWLSRTGRQTTFDASVVAADDAEPGEPVGPAAKIADANVSLEAGVFHIAGTFDDGRRRSLTVNARDVALAETSIGAKAVGVSAGVRLDGPATAPSTGPTQVVRIEKLTASKLELTDAVIRFEIGPGGTVRVREAKANLLGGVVSAEDVRYVPDEPIALTLVTADLDLAEMLKLLAPGKASGEGKVNGRLPLVIGRDGSVRLAEGTAEARAGGTIRVTDTAALEAVAGSAASGTKDPSPQGQVRQNIVEALKDFQYESLTARLKRDPDNGLVAHVRMVGKGRTGAQQALDYDLRVTGLEDLLRSLVGVHRTVTQEAARP